MFGLFKKRKKPIHELPIWEAIVECKRQGAENLGINLYIQDQILFQVMSAKQFEDKGGCVLRPILCDTFLDFYACLKLGQSIKV